MINATQIKRRNQMRMLPGTARRREYYPEGVAEVPKGDWIYAVPEAVMNSINFMKLEQAIGYTFQDKSLLVAAISHASCPTVGVPCYQRLEFLGDALLNHLVTQYFFCRHLDLLPGDLTDLRAATVNNENFARISVKHSFHEHLRHESSDLDSDIRRFVKAVQGELVKPGINSFGIEDVKAPKVLGIILESIAGAIFLDTGLDTEQVWKVFDKLLQPMVTPDTVSLEPVKELHDLPSIQPVSERLKYNRSKAGSVFTVEVFVDGVQISSAESTQTKMAEKLAARRALLVLKERDQPEEGSRKMNKTAKANNSFARQTLNDMCSRRQWAEPQYRRLHESGPAHAKQFTYTVCVNTRERGWTKDFVGEAMPSVKEAKESAALVLLELLKQMDLEMEGDHPVPRFFRTTARILAIIVLFFAFLVLCFPPLPQ